MRQVGGVRVALHRDEGVGHGGQTQRAVSLPDVFVAQGIARDATRATLLIDDVLLLDQVTNGQEVTVGFLATNGNREESNEADAKFTLRLGAAP